MKKKLRFDANLPQRVEITYANGKVDVFDEILDFSVQEIGTDRKECTVDVRITMATLEGKGMNLFKWLVACIKSVFDRFVEDDPEQLRDEERGLYRKYYVRKIDDPTGKHKNCFFFVLDLTHDPYAIPAARAYADACRGRFPILAKDLESFSPSKPKVLRVGRTRNDR